MLKLFNLKPEDVVGAKRHHVCEALKMFMRNIPVFAEASVVDGIAHTKVGYFQYSVKPLLKEHWGNLGLPDNFDLMTEDELDPIRKAYTNRKRWFLGDKKQMLNMATLADMADDLRRQYKIARTRYKKCKSSFFTLNPNGNDRKWQDQWAHICSAEFPALHPRATKEIEHSAPFELVNIHLAANYDYDEETIRKKLAEARRMRAAG